MQILSSSIRAIVRPFIALVSIVSSCIHPQGHAETASLQNGWSSLQCPGAPAVLYHDLQALIAQPKASDHISLEWIADSGAGRDFASCRAFNDQGIPNSVIQSST